MSTSNQQSHPLVRLARQAVEGYVTTGKLPKPLASELGDEMKETAGVFVSIKKHGNLRGCIGTFESTTQNIAIETIVNAVNAATRDPRFPPVRQSELSELDYSVDVLTRPVPVDDPSKLNPRKHGIIVQSGFRRGLLLPDLDGVDTLDQQIDICRQKAGIMEGEPIKLYSFEVVRHK